MNAALIGIGFGCAVFMVAFGVACAIRWAQARLAATQAGSTSSTGPGKTEGGEKP